MDEQNISASVYVENLRNGVNMGIDEEKGYFPASLNKLPDGEDAKNSIGHIVNSIYSYIIYSYIVNTRIELDIYKNQTS